MAGVRVRFKPDRAAFAELRKSGAIAQGVLRAAGKVRDDAKRIIHSEGRINTGRLLNSVTADQQVSVNSGVVSARVGSTLHYAIYQHEGVGPIVPRRARVLRFRPKGSATYVFAQRTSGFKGIFFLTKAVGRLTPGDFKA